MQTWSSTITVDELLALQTIFEMEDVVSTFAAQAKDGIFFMNDKIDYSVIPPVAPGEDVEYGYFYTSKPANSELTQDVSNAEYIKEIIIDFYWSFITRLNAGSYNLASSSFLYSCCPS